MATKAGRTKQTAAKKAATKKPATKKAGPRKAVAKKTAPRKAAAKKTVAKKAAAKKPATREAAAKKAARRPAAKKSAAKKSVPTRPAAKKPAGKAATTKPARKPRPSTHITPEQALANTRRLLEAKHAHDSETPPWQALEARHGTAPHAGFQDGQARDQANELHAGESDMQAIQGAIGTRDRHNQGKRDKR